MRRIFTRIVRCIVCLPMLAVAGCNTATTAPPESAERDYEHQHSHELPAHRPKNVAQAAAEIKKRVAGIETPASDETAREQQLAELLDIVRWLPELAAESDLSEADWTTIDGESKSVEKKLAAENQQARQQLPLDETLRTAVLSLADTVHNLTDDGRWAVLERDPTSKDEEESARIVERQEDTGREAASH
jgi:hypothetical protein